MDRRTFLRSSAALAGTALLFPGLSLAGLELNKLIGTERFKTPGIFEIEALLGKFGFKYVETNQEKYAREDLELEERFPDMLARPWRESHIEWIYESKQLEEVEEGMLEQVRVRYYSEDERITTSLGTTWFYWIDHEIGNTKQLYLDLDYCRGGGRPYGSLLHVLNAFPSQLHVARRNGSRSIICPDAGAPPMNFNKYMAWAQERGFINV
jgi:hypothetical protein